MKIYNSKILIITTKASRVSKAYKEASEVRKLNEQVTQENKQIRKENKVRKTRGKAPLELFPLSFLNEEWVEEIIKEEKSNLQKLKAKGASEWREYIDKLEEPLRAKVACLIWWDFFAGRKVSERWSHLDDIIENVFDVTDTPEPSEDSVIVALYHAGFTPYRAIKRIRGDWESYA